MYDLGDRLLMVASDRISTYDVVHPNADPGQGQGPDRAVGVLVRARPATSSRTTSSRPPTGVPEEARGRAIVARKLEMLPVECVVRGYITGSGWKDYQAHRHGQRASSCRPACRSPSACRRRSSRRRRRPRRATTRRSTSTRPPSSSATATSSARLRDVSIALYSFAADHARERGVILADTKFEFGLDDDGELVARRRGAHARLLALLARRRLRSRAARSRASTSSTCATGPRGTGWDKTPPAPEIPDDVVDGHARALRRGLRADHRRVVRRLAREDARDAARPRPRPAEGGHPRPAGHRGRAGAARRSASTAWPTSTSAGSSSSTSTTRRRSPAMCEKLLANPLIEDYEVVGREVRRRPVPRARATRSTRCRPCERVGDAEAPLAQRPRPAAASTRSSSPAGSPTATTCASARSRASRRSWSRSPRSRARAARCSASATASRSCARRGLLPGALLPNLERRFVCRQVDIEVVDADDARGPRACARRRACCRSRSSTRPAATTRPPSSSTTSASSSATRTTATRTARRTTSPASPTPRATSSG